MKDLIIWIIIWLSLTSLVTYAKSDECFCKPQKPVVKPVVKEVKPVIKKETITRLGFCTKQWASKEFCERLKYQCDKTRNTIKCFWMWMSISFAETSYKFKHFGIMREDNNPEWFAKRWNKYWYKATEMSFFYWENGKTWASHYCTSEESSWTNGWCPNWFRNSSFMLNKYKQYFIIN